MLGHADATFIGQKEIPRFFSFGNLELALKEYAFKTFLFVTFASLFFSLLKFLLDSRRKKEGVLRNFLFPHPSCSY